MRLSEQSQHIAVEKGQLLFVHSSVADRFFIIFNGWIKLFRETLDGAQAVIDVLTTGHFFGEASIFQEGVYPYSAEAAESSELLSLPLSLLKTEIETNPKLAMAMLSSIAQQGSKQNRELEHRTLQNAPQRIGCFILRLADQQQSGPTAVHLPYDKNLVAARLGMQAETFSRALSKLKQETGININGATIEMNDISQLRDYSCSACSSEFPCKDLTEKSRYSS